MTRKGVSLRRGRRRAARRCADDSARRRTRLALEALPFGDSTARASAEDLERDRAIDPRVARPVDLPHAARADGRDDPIGTEVSAPGEAWVSHVWLTRLRRGRRSAPRRHVLQLEIAEQTMQVGRIEAEQPRRGGVVAAACDRSLRGSAAAWFRARSRGTPRPRRPAGPARRPRSSPGDRRQ